ncbi:MAG: hypothetical protein SOX31_11475, partial [Eubacteriales bacterium]|nr:hypothetical protein [Eubacteriales bacterium]
MHKGVPKKSFASSGKPLFLIRRPHSKKRRKISLVVSSGAEERAFFPAPLAVMFRSVARFCADYSLMMSIIAYSGARTQYPKTDNCPKTMDFSCSVAELADQHRRVVRMV